MQINPVCSDFIQRLLKKRFPQLNPFRKNNRVIPKFRCKIISPAPPQIDETSGRTQINISDQQQLFIQTRIKMVYKQKPYSL